MTDASPHDALDTLPFIGTTPYGRPSWSGLLQFSLVGIPLKAYPAVRTRDVPTAHLLHADCGQRLRYAKHCPVHGPVDAAAIVRGYEYGPGQHVVAQPDELDRLRPARDKALRLERFLAPAQLDPLLFAGRSLYLVPDGKAAEPGYGVLRSALAHHQRWALGRMVLGGHRQVVLVRPASTNLVLHVLHYPEQVRVCPQTVWPLEKEPVEELRLAGMLIEAAAGKVDWMAYPDQAAEELKGLIEAKLAGQAAAEAMAPPRILSLLEALQRSVGARNGNAVASRVERKTPTPATAKPRTSRKRARRTA
jgi:DNA end-binding protein Ku